MEAINTALSIFALASVLGTVAATFYGVRQKTIIATLEQSNKAYAERNGQLEAELKLVRTTHAAAISELQGKVSTLEKMKTPPFKPMMELIQKNHQEVMAAVNRENQ